MGRESESPFLVHSWWAAHRGVQLVAGYQIAGEPSRIAAVRPRPRGAVGGGPRGSASAGGWWKLSEVGKATAAARRKGPRGAGRIRLRWSGEVVQWGSRTIKSGVRWLGNDRPQKEAARLVGPVDNGVPDTWQDEMAW